MIGIQILPSVKQRSVNDLQNDGSKLPAICNKNNTRRNFNTNTNSFKAYCYLSLSFDCQRHVPHTHIVIDLPNHKYNHVTCLSCRDFDHSYYWKSLVPFYDAYNPTPLHFCATNLLGKLKRTKPVATTSSRSIIAILHIVDSGYTPPTMSQ